MKALFDSDDDKNNNISTINNNQLCSYYNAPDIVLSDFHTLTELVLTMGSYYHCSHFKDRKPRNKNQGIETKIISLVNDRGGS